MGWLRALLVRLGRSGGKASIERGIRDEIRFHIEMRTRANEERGLDPDEARADAIRRFGDDRWVLSEGQKTLAAAAPTVDEGGTFLDTLRQDLTFAFRRFKRSPGLTVVIVASVALGLGANSATFSIADSLLRYTAPVEDPDRLVRLFVTLGDGATLEGWSYPDFADVRARTRLFEGLVAETPRPMHLGVGDANLKVWGSLVSGDYFSVLGVEAAIGRVFLPGEDVTPDTHPVVVLSRRLWVEHLGAAPGAVGREVTLNGRSHTIVGIAPEGFTGTNVGVEPDLWVPMAMAPALVPGIDILTARSYHGLPFVMGRLRQGATIEQARTAVRETMAELTAEDPSARTAKSVVVIPERLAALHPRLRAGFTRFMWLMFATVGMILLLTCANVAGLLLARATADEREMGLRRALGAGRRRIVRQLLTESLVLGAGAGLVGLATARSLVRVVEWLQPATELPLAFRAEIDGGVLAFLFLATMLTTLLFGLAPSLHGSRPGAWVSLKAGSRTASPDVTTARRVLVGGQVALSLVLLIGATVAVRSLERTLDGGLGFNTDGLYVATVDLDLQGYAPAEVHGFRAALEPRVRSLPGVQSVALSIEVPLSLRTTRGAVEPDGVEGLEAANPPIVDMNAVDDDYFTVMGIPLIRGRVFTDADARGARAVALVNETFAQRFWPNREAVGRTVRVAGTTAEVVGVVADGRYLTAGEPSQPHVYRSLAQVRRGSFYMLFRAVGSPDDILPMVREEILALDPTLPDPVVRPATQAMAVTLLPSRLAAGVVSAFALVALLLVATGLYGILASSVERRYHDIGIRRALGAHEVGDSAGGCEGGRYHDGAGDGSRPARWARLDTAHGWRARGGRAVRPLVVPGRVRRAGFGRPRRQCVAGAQGDHSRYARHASDRVGRTWSSGLRLVLWWARHRIYP